MAILELRSSFLKKEQSTLMLLTESSDSVHSPGLPDSCFLPNKHKTVGHRAPSTVTLFPFMTETRKGDDLTLFILIS